MTRTLTDGEVATHDNTLEQDPDPIVNGDDVAAPQVPPVERDEIVTDDEDEDDDEIDEDEDAADEDDGTLGAS